MTKRSYLIAALLLGLAFVAMPVDRMLTQLLNHETVPGEIQTMLFRAEAFGHGYGVLFIILTVWMMTRCHVRKLGPLLACSFGAGLMADVIKVNIGRIRPHAAPDDLAASTFTGFLPWWGSESLHDTFNHAYQSFPSAHTATAVGLAACLAWMYPQSSKWFFTLAGLVAVQRMVSGAHYLSDVLAGAALGVVVATMVIRYVSANQRAGQASEQTVLKTQLPEPIGKAA